jgi:hypothetical protein
MILLKGEVVQDEIAGGAEVEDGVNPVVTFDG